MEIIKYSIQGYNLVAISMYVTIMFEFVLCQAVRPNICTVFQPSRKLGSA